MKKNTWVLFTLFLCVPTLVVPNKINDWETAVLHFQNSAQNNVPLHDIVKNIPKKFEPALLRNIPGLTQKIISDARAIPTPPTPPASSTSSSASSSRSASPIPFDRRSKAITEDDLKKVKKELKKITPKKFPKPANQKSYLDWLQGFDIVEENSKENRHTLNPDFYGKDKTAHENNVGNTVDGIILLKDAVPLIDENAVHDDTNPNHWAHKHNPFLIAITHGSHAGKFALDTDVAYFEDKDMYIPLIEALNLEKQGLISLEENEDFGPWKATSVPLLDEYKPAVSPKTITFDGDLRSITPPAPLIPEVSTSKPSATDNERVNLLEQIRNANKSNLKPAGDRILPETPQTKPTNTKKPKSMAEVLAAEMEARRLAIDDSDSEDDNNSTSGDNSDWDD